MGITVISVVIPVGLFVGILCGQTVGIEDDSNLIPCGPISCDKRSSYCNTGFIRPECSRCSGICANSRIGNSRSAIQNCEERCPVYYENHVSPTTTTTTMSMTRSVSPVAAAVVVGSLDTDDISSNDSGHYQHDVLISVVVSCIVSIIIVVLIVLLVLKIIKKKKRQTRRHIVSRRGPTRDVEMRGSRLMLTNEGTVQTVTVPEITTTALQRITDHNQRLSRLPGAHRTSDHNGIAHRTSDHNGVAHQTSDHNGVAHQTSDHNGVYRRSSEPQEVPHTPQLPLNHHNGPTEGPSNTRTKNNNFTHVVNPNVHEPVASSTWPGQAGTFGVPPRDDPNGDKAQKSLALASSARYQGSRSNGTATQATTTTVATCPDEEEKERTYVKLIKDQGYSPTSDIQQDSTDTEEVEELDLRDDLEEDAVRQQQQHPLLSDTGYRTAPGSP